MKADAREKKVKFADKAVYDAYERLKDGNFEEKELHRMLTSTFRELEKNPLLGVKVPSAVWPAIYVKKYGIDNLRKCNLTSAWRLVYTLDGSDIEIVSVILEWFDSHKKYEKRFGYKKK